MHFFSLDIICSTDQNGPSPQHSDRLVNGIVCSLGRVGNDFMEVPRSSWL